ncbi:MAG: cell division protein FtsA [Candidatus Omnitrophica bacterium]|nr:cell division protein FtsA [Candidatus Omnitrophota bacterium]
MKIGQFVGQFFKDIFFCGLDIGSQKVKACLGQVKDSNNLELLAVYEVDTRGFRDASVNDISAFSACIGSALDAVAKKAQVRFRDVYLGVGGDLVETRVSRAVIPLAERGNKVITPADVREARRQARLLGVRLDEDVLCDFVQQFRVDDVNIALNPVGLCGRKLEVEVMLVVAGNTRLRNITKAVKQAGFEVGNTFFNGQALADTVLSMQQKTDGIVLVDVGARSTQAMIFKEGLLKHYVKAATGCQEMTQGIADALNIGPDLAEDVKRSYVRVRDDKTMLKNDEILIKKDQAFVPVQRSVLSEAIEPQVVRLVEMIRGAVEASGYGNQLKGGMMMVGGGALLPGFLERVEGNLGMPVALGRGIAGLNNASSYCVCTSVAELAYKGSHRYQFDTRTAKDWMDAWKMKAEEICNEYF